MFQRLFDFYRFYPFRFKSTQMQSAIFSKVPVFSTNNLVLDKHYRKMYVSDSIG